MELSDYEETCTSEMAYDASQNYSARCEKEETALFLREEIRFFFMGNKPRAVKVVDRLLMENHCIKEVENHCIKEVITALYGKFFCPDDPNLSEEVNVLRQMVMDLNKNSVAYEEMSQYISEVIENIKRNQLMDKFKLFIFLLAFLLHSGNDDYKRLATPEREKISCITVYMLGNDGAHSYNGNGILLTTRRKYARFKNEELLDEIRPANLPLDVLQRQPTDKEIARLSGKLGQEYRLLAYELGLTRVQLDHLTLDCPTTLLRIERMFFIWRDDIEGNATFEILVKAMGMHGINPEIVCQCLERA